MSVNISNIYFELWMKDQIRIRTHDLGRALQRHRRGHGFESRSSSLNYFAALFSQLLKLRTN